MELGEGGNRKENDRQSTISEYIIPLQVEDMICTESC
jgi:hypothetical protein